MFLSFFTVGVFRERGVSCCSDEVSMFLLTTIPCFCYCSGDNVFILTTEVGWCLYVCCCSDGFSVVTPSVTMFFLAMTVMTTFPR
jgi:hypothetical protein